MNTKFSSYVLPRKRRRTSLNKCVLSNEETSDSSESPDVLFVSIESRPGVEHVTKSTGSSTESKVPHVLPSLLEILHFLSLVL